METTQTTHTLPTLSLRGNLIETWRDHPETGTPQPMLIATLAPRLDNYGPAIVRACNSHDAVVGALEACDRAFVAWQLGQIPGRPERYSGADNAGTRRPPRREGGDAMTTARLIESLYKSNCPQTTADEICDRLQVCDEALDALERIRDIHKHHTAAGPALLEAQDIARAVLAKAQRATPEGEEWGDGDHRL